MTTGSVVAHHARDVVGFGLFAGGAGGGRSRTALLPAGRRRASANNYLLPSDFILTNTTWYVITTDWSIAPDLPHLSINSA
jgi:hypothetical protein